MGSICHATGKICITLVEPFVQANANLQCTMLFEQLRAELLEREATMLTEYHVQVDGGGDM